jgi:predicted transcriptional regulator
VLTSKREEDGHTSLKKRSRLETKYDILKAIKQEGEARPTHIMYKANVSWIIMKEFLEVLESQNLISAGQEHSGHKKYVLTAKGIESLDTMMSAKLLLGQAEDE